MTQTTTQPSRTAETQSGEIGVIVRSLTQRQRQILLAAVPVDCGEYWLRHPVDDDRLSGSDLVLTELGIAVRAALVEERA